jgi:hypothetical protein
VFNPEVPSALDYAMALRVIRHPGFFSGYFSQEDPLMVYERIDTVLELVKVGNYILDMRVILEPNYLVLHLRHERSTETGDELGYDDDCSMFINEILRWEEVDLLGRYVEQRVPQIMHPGLIVGLLCRFAPLTAGDDADHVIKLVTSAWAALRRGPDDGSEHSGVPRLSDEAAHIEHLDHRNSGFHWREDGAGNWVLLTTGPLTAYTIREPGGPFPFEAWRGFMEAVAAATDLVS